MKKIILSIAMLLFACIAFWACNETNVAEPQSLKNNASSKALIKANALRSTDYSLAKFDGEMLNFETEEDFFNVRQSLIEDYNNHIASYTKSLAKKGINEEEMDIVAYKEGFDFNITLKNFEHEVGNVKSARSAIEPQYVAWSQQDNVSANDNPYFKIGADMFTAALLNEKSEVRIAGKIINFIQQLLLFKPCGKVLHHTGSIFYSGSGKRMFGNLYVLISNVSASSRVQSKFLGRWIPSLKSTCVRVEGVVYNWFTCKVLDANIPIRCFPGFVVVTKFFPTAISCKPGTGHLKSIHSCPAWGLTGSVSI